LVCSSESPEEFQTGAAKAMVPRIASPSLIYGEESTRLLNQEYRRRVFGRQVRRESDRV
jgi:hypothetical protein